MDANTEQQEILRQQQLRFAAQMENGPACPELDDVPYDELKSRYEKASGALLSSMRNGKVSPEEQKFFDQLQEQYEKARVKWELQNLESETNMDGGKRRRATESPLFVHQDC